MVIVIARVDVDLRWKRHKEPKTKVSMKCTWINPCVYRGGGGGGGGGMSMTIDIPFHRASMSIISLLCSKFWGYMGDAAGMGVWDMEG